MTSPFLPSRFVITEGLASDDQNVFPLLAGQSFLVSKRPIWSTQITTASSGGERRRRLWSFPKWSFKCSYEVLRDDPTDADLERLIAFFLLHAGRFQNFGFLDPGDNEVISQPFGTGDGVTTTFQLTRLLSFGGVTFTEPVQMLVGTPTVLVGTSPVETFTLAPGGLLTFATAPATGAALTWSGRFLFLVRFDQDDLDLQQMMQGLWSQSGIAFMSEKR